MGVFLAIAVVLEGNAHEISSRLEIFLTLSGAAPAIDSNAPKILNLTPSNEDNIVEWGKLIM